MFGLSFQLTVLLTGHYIKDIDRGSPAERAGLKEMDRLVAVEGDEVDNLAHDQVVDKIRQRGNKCCLLVVDEVTDKMYKLVSGNQVINVVRERESEREVR